VVKKVSYEDFDEDTIKDYTEREIQILSKTKHPNIISLKMQFPFKNGSMQILEYAELGDLKKNLNPSECLNEELVFAIFKEIYSGVLHLRENSIVHRDLKIDNILINSKYEIKVCDLGLAQEVDYNETKMDFENEDLGSPQCVAPEAIEKKSTSLGTVDVWALGCILYYLTFGFYPFEKTAKKIADLRNNICNLPISYNHSHKIKYFDEFEDFAKRLLEKDTNKRIPLRDIQNDSYFKKNESKQ